MNKMEDPRELFGEFPNVKKIKFFLKCSVKELSFVRPCRALSESGRVIVIDENKQAVLLDSKH